MPLMNVPTTRSGDSLPAELRIKNPANGYDRVFVGQAGVTGQSRRWGWHRPVYLAGLGQEETPAPAIDWTDPTTVITDGTVLPSGDTYAGPPTTVSELQLSGALGGGYAGSVAPPLPAGTPVVAVSGYPSAVKPNVTPPTPPAGYVYANVVDQFGTTVAKILAINKGMGSQTLPNGAQIIYPAGTQSTLISSTGTLGTGGAGAVNVGAGGLSALFSGSTGIILVLGLGLLFVMSRGK